MVYNYKKEITLDIDYDVVVAGGGPAGICAAVSAARMGVSVLLVERHGVLGGNLTMGNISPILGHVAPKTMYDEIISLLKENHKDAREVVTHNGNEVHIDHEEAKGIFANLVIDSGAKFMLCTSIVDIIKDKNKITGVILNTPEGLCGVKAGVVIDATGDGQASYLAGAECKVGRDSDGLCQPTTLEFVVEGVDESIGITAWGESDPVKLPDGREYRSVCREKNRMGELPENVSIVRLHRTFYPGERSVNATQLNNVNSLDPLTLAYAEIELRNQIQKVVAFLKANVPGFQNCKIKNSASVLGVRETRRVIGDFVIDDSVVENGTKFDDVIVHNAWFLIDIHNPKGGGQAEGLARDASPYDIPYRALLPLGLENILTAGRCISGTHRAHASYRVMAICMAMGESAGIAAALAVKNKTTPRKVAVKDIQKELILRGAKLFD